MVAQLEVSLFGPMGIKLHGKPLHEVHERKAHLLLGLLLLRHGREVERAFLAKTLWPNDNAALRNLRSSLHHLRTLLGDESSRLHTSKTTAQFDLHDMRVDVIQFDQAIARNNIAGWQVAVACYGGPLLEDSDEAWLGPERKLRERQYIAALKSTAAFAKAQGAFATSVERLRRVIDLDYLDYDAQTILMRTYAAMQNFAAVTRVFETLSDQLARDRRPGPPPYLIELYAALQADGERLESGGVLREAGPQAEGRLNIPPPAPGFVGRRAEIVEIRAYLGAERVVTLTGCGGIGKTRLALEVASGLASEFRNGVWFVDLRTVRDATQLPAVLLASLGFREEPSRPIVETLQESLASWEALLVLDNLEQLEQGAGDIIGNLLSTCPRLRVLGTSRTNVGISGERVYDLPTLAVPAPSDPAEVDVVLQYDAVRLFVRCAEPWQRFSLSGANAATVAELCRRLDGLPLAIELAAAQTRTQTVEQILTQLHGRLRFTGIDTAGDVRHETLHATLDWSYDLLSQPQQILFKRLSVFAGPFDLEAVSRICADANAPIQRLLAGLVRHSLVRMAKSAAGVRRYSLLETIRLYASEKLTESGESAALHMRHRDWFLEVAERAYRALDGPDQLIWLRRLDDSIADLRAALEWSIEAGQIDEAGRLAAALWKFWERRGHLNEGRSWLHRVLDDPRAQGTTLTRMKLLTAAGNLAYHQGDYAVARTLHSQSLSIASVRGDKHGLSVALNNVGLVSWKQGKLDEALTQFKQGLAIDRELAVGEDGRGSPYTADVAISLHNIGNVLLDKGRYAAARPRFEESLKIRRAQKDPRGVAQSLTGLGNVATGEGDQEEDEAKRRQFYTEARTRHQDSLAIRVKLEDPEGIATARLNLGIITDRLGEHAMAQVYCQDSLLERCQLGDKLGVAEALEEIAGLAATQGQSGRSARLFGAAERLRQVIGAPLPLGDKAEYARRLANARAAMDEEAFTAAWAEGGEMSLATAVEYASSA